MGGGATLECVAQALERLSRGPRALVCGSPLPSHPSNTENSSTESNPKNMNTMTV